MERPSLPPLRSVHSTNLPAILTHLGASLLVSTYQAGKLVVVRADGDVVNTHFHPFNKPMGVAVAGGRLAIGTAVEIAEFQNVPAVAAKLPPVGKHDACFLPRLVHCTGNVHIHELAFAQGELWFVNTRFSCLCTRSETASFQPRWRPPFVTALAPEDRCHLNGLGVREGTVRYVTALGETDDAAGWRANKRSGGVVIDVTTGATLLRGLSMPHSPRWYRGRLWLLESGTGTLGFLDETAGNYVPVATLPGFTRGLDFAGPLAFVGLSQVRETAVFSGLPITERSSDRNCGVWVVNIESGQIIALLKFEEAVQEVFAVQVLPGMRFPDLIHDDADLLGESFVLPDEALAEVPASLRTSPISPRTTVGG